MAQTRCDSFPLAWDRLHLHDTDPHFFPIHSHSRGTDLEDNQIHDFEDDSFPLARDKVEASMLSRNQARVIPTHVEQTTQTFSWHRHDATHSHAGGTDDGLKVTACETCDSFPPAWDKLLVQQIQNLSDRLIPTHVGQTLFSSMVLPTLSIHSHARGTNCLGISDIYIKSDSFPRTWDKPYKYGLCIFAVHYILCIFVV
mgnify:CR=1 FL=1